MDMEKQQPNKQLNKPTVEFSNCENYGDQIKALVSYYTNTSIKTFVLEKAQEQIEKNDKEIQNLVEGLLNKE